METLLKVEGINVYYGAIHAIKDISFQVNQGEIVTLIGANGAGKTTTLQTISGLLGGCSFRCRWRRTWRWGPIPSPLPVCPGIWRWCTTCFPA